MKGTKKVFTALLALLMLAAFSVSSFAAPSAEDDSMKTDAGYGLSFEEPIEKMSRSGQIPTSVWNLSTKGRYTFEGSADGSANLYTLYRFNGARRYKICVFNESSSEVTVKPKREAWTYVTQKIPGNDSAIFYIDVGSTSTSFYILFEKSHHVSGYIEVA